MKKLFLILTTALFAAGFASCTDDPEETVNPVVVSEILRALGGNVLVNVTEEFRREYSRRCCVVGSDQ